MAPPLGELSRLKAVTERALSAPYGRFAQNDSVGGELAKFRFIDLFGSILSYNGTKNKNSHSSANYCVY